MPSVFFAALLAISVATSAFATEASKFPNTSIAVTSFNSAFKDATDVSWSQVGDLSKVSFVSEGVRMEGFYNMDGDMVGLAKGISIESLPVDAKRTFAKKYDGYLVKEVIQFDTPTEVAYYISADKGNQSVVFKVNSASRVSIFKTSSK